jgi:hypothetical protein
MTLIAHMPQIPSDPQDVLDLFRSYTTSFAADQRRLRLAFNPDTFEPRLLKGRACVAVEFVPGGVAAQAHLMTQRLIMVELARHADGLEPHVLNMLASFIKRHVSTSGLA